MVDTSPWLVEFYASRTEGCPVRGFLLGLDVPRRAKLVAIIRLLEEQGPTLPFPYSSQIRGKLRELRTHYGKEHYRVLYCAMHRMGILMKKRTVRGESSRGAAVRPSR
jgi:hypothetical protein